MIEQSRLLTLNAAHMMDTVGNRVAKAEIAMIKVAVPNMACQVIDWAIQAHGGGGTSNDFGLAAAYATARLLRLADGPDEVHRNQIARLEPPLAPSTELRLPERERLMITLYHCDGARSFRPLWMLEEMGLPYELKMLPFPPRVFAKEYLAINPLGTIPFMVDGETKMTESSGICYYLGTKYGPTPLVVGLDDPAYGAFLNWMYFSDATLTFPQTLVLRYSQLEPEERRNPQVAGDYAKWFLGRLRAVEAATGKWPKLVRRAVHRGRYRQRLCAASGGQYRPRQGFWPQCRGLLGPVAGTRRLQARGCGGTQGRRRAERRAAGTG